MMAGQPMAVTKQALLSALREQLSHEVETMTRLAREAAEAATHEENRPENDKDMRSTEASYVAKGQADRVRGLERALSMLAVMPLREFAAGDGISISALVTTSAKGASTTHFLVPAAGGIKLEVAGERVQSLATDSPLGQALLGLSEGDTAEVRTPRGMLAYDVLSVR